MITKMKKLTFLVYHKEYEQFLKGLRDVGVVDVEKKQSGIIENPLLQDHMREAAHYADTIKMLKRLNVKTLTSETKPSAEQGRTDIKSIDSMISDRTQLQQQLQACLKDKIAMQPWGNFDIENLDKLRKYGYQVHFYVCPTKNFKDSWGEDFQLIKINEENSKTYFVIVTHMDENIELEIEQTKIPNHSLSELEIQQRNLELNINKINANLEHRAETEIPSLKLAMQEIQSSIEFSKVILNTESKTDDKLMLLEGWAPINKLINVENYMADQPAYFEISAPTPDDDVPILFNNNKFAKLFEPICRLYMLPKYNELDLTPFFAPFFMLFFGLCLGDIGYGLLLFLSVTIFRICKKDINKEYIPYLSLIQLLGGSTFVCGFLTGTFFGFNVYEIQIPFIQTMKNTICLDNKQMFNLSLILGAIQILFGMCLKAYNKTIQFGFKYAVETICWIIFLLSTAFAALQPQIMPLGGTIYTIILAITGCGIFFYNTPGKNIFMNFGLGIWNSYNMATGLLGDILSYVRLFALGLSGGILANVFDQLAVGMSPDNIILGPIVMVVIFLAGHSINIFMNVLGAMVHPMRLTFVEFFKNSGYEGGGKEYKPFKKQ